MTPAQPAPGAVARAAMHAAVRAVVAGGTSDRARAAIAGAQADLWACDRLSDAAEHAPEAAAVAPYLVPRLLLDAVDGLTPALGPLLLSPDESAAEYRHHVRVLAALTGAPGAAGRMNAVAARLPFLAACDDRLAAPLTSVRTSALAPPLGTLVQALEEERRAVALRAIDLATPDEAEAGSRRAESWGLADRYALLTAAAACLDEWRGPAGPRRRGAGSRACLIGALSRIAAGLCLPVRVPGREWNRPAFDAVLAAHTPQDPRPRPVRHLLTRAA
ncbi:hypothetical protein OG338_11530 [Streptomyces sp. NBC_00726]|uniref:hypothetical protein n=1 Tax=Streptomyces sp. NBC_00726 TaxID=2903674 RepID=UPI00386FFBBE